MANTIRLKRASGSDPGASDLVTGELAVRTDTAKLFTKKDDNSVAEIGASIGTDDVDTAAIQDDAVTFAKIQNIGNNKIAGRISSGTGNIEQLSAANVRSIINVEDGATADQTKSDIDGLGIAASTAATLATARTIAGVSFDGSANISLNNNAITNGAGYITATLTNEQVQDIVGGMLTGNTETGITVTYQDGDGTIDFVVGTLNQDTTGNAATATALETARNIGGVSFDGTGNINLPGVNTSGNQNTSGNAATATKLATARTIAGVSFDGSANISLNNNAITNGAGYITSADGGNAATLDSIDSSQFLRSDTTDTASSVLTLTSGLSFGSDAKCAAGVSALSDGSTITVNFTSGIHHSVTLGGNRTFGNPSNDANAVGQSGSIFITQDGTGSRTASFHSDYKFAGGTAPTLSTAANAVDRLDYVIKASGVIHCVVTLDVKQMAFFDTIRAGASGAGTD